MGRMTLTRTIDAPVDRVFETVSDISSFSEAIPEIVKVEMLSDVHVGVGARFRETRRMGRREHTVELHVTEYEKNDHVRLVSDAGGTIWDTVFTVRPAADGPGAELTMVMDARPYKVAAKVFTPVVSRLIRNAVERDMDAVKAYCERGRAADDA